MTRHLTASDIDRFRRGEIGGADVLELSRHLDACADCAALSRDHVGLDAATASIRASFGIDDGASSPEVPRPRPARNWRIMAATAAAFAALVIATAIVMTRSESKPIRTQRIESSSSPPHDISYGRADWDSQLAEARSSGRVLMPEAVRELRRPRDMLRGTPALPASHLSPMGEAIEARQPRFTWAALPGAHYVVRVFAGREQVAQSPTLSAVGWSADRSLRRGVTYSWQVEVIDRDMVIPSPPDPPALFLIIDDKTALDIAEARRRFPHDHLLLGVLCARAGLRSCAGDELRHFAEEHPNDSAAARLVTSVSAW